MRHSARILLVDDDPIMRELAASKLREAGFDLLLAEDGAVALQILSDKPVDLVICDIDMPNVDGFELTDIIRRSPRLRTLPVIVITASDHPEAVERAFAVGATSFLAKPMNWTLLGHSVRFILKASADQKALREARDHAEAGGRFKDSLMSVMSHELRTPLNAIIGFGQLIGEQFERENDLLNKEYADYIVEGGKRLLNSVSDMLLASDARSGPIGISEIDCTLGEIVDLALAPLEKTIDLASAEVRVLLENPLLELCCDRQLVARAIGKLVENSVKFGQRGVKILIASVRMMDGRLAIVVEDDGPGMAPDRLRISSQSFTSADVSPRRSKEGLGLGLPLVSAIASAHGGAFKIQSEIGRGAKAFIFLPAVRISGGGALRASVA